jgi:hypothetical protein
LKKFPNIWTVNWTLTPANKLSSTSKTAPSVRIVLKRLRKPLTSAEKALMKKSRMIFESASGPNSGIASKVIENPDDGNSKTAFHFLKMQSDLKA